MFLIDGIPVACVGDKATCPTHKVVATIVSGDPCMQIFGKAAARVNDSLSCGCKLLPQQNLVVQITVVALHHRLQIFISSNFTEATSHRQFC